MCLIFAKCDITKVISQYWFQQEITNSRNLTCSFCRINRYVSHVAFVHDDSLRLSILTIS